MAHDVVIKIKDINGDDVAIIIEREVERNPLHPEALVLTDLKVGTKIQVNHEYDNDRSYSAVVVGSPTTNEYGSTVIPLVRLGDKPDYIMGYPKDMGLTPYQEGCRSWWNHTWYTTVAE